MQSRRAVTFIAVLVLVLLAGCTAISKRHPGMGFGSVNTTPSGEPRLVGVALDAIDGQIVVGTWEETVAPDTTAERRAVSDGLTWTIVSGQANITRDPYTGYTLFTPIGDEPVVARPRIGTLVGAPVTIGMRPDSLPADQRTFMVPGGGMCADNPNHLMASTTLDVRSVVNATVIPISNTERVLRYRTNGEYYTWDAKAGVVRLSYNPNYTSQVRLRSHSPTGTPFFPAAVETQLFLQIEMVDSGVRLYNKQPLVLRKASTNWPPFQEPLLNNTPVDFYDERNPDVVALTIISQESYLYPTQELDIRRKTFTIEGGMLDATFEVRNLTENAADVRWFFIGNLGTPETPVSGTVKALPGGTFEVRLRTVAPQAAVQQFITLGAVSQSAQRLSGFERVEFRYPGITQPVPATP